MAAASPARLSQSVLRVLPDPLPLRPRPRSQALSVTGAVAALGPWACVSGCSAAPVTLTQEDPAPSSCPGSCTARGGAPAPPAPGASQGSRDGQHPPARTRPQSRLNLRRHRRGQTSGGVKAGGQAGMCSKGLRGSPSLPKSGIAPLPTRTPQAQAALSHTGGAVCRMTPLPSCPWSVRMLSPTTGVTTLGLGWGTG